MKIGILSDTHDNLRAIDAALDELVSRGVEALVHAGDFVAPFALKRVLQTRLPVYGVFGNCDGEREGLSKLLPELTRGPLKVELGGLKIVVIHESERLSREAAMAADVIVTGHTHEPEIRRDEGRLLVNPGECCGWVTGRSTVAVLDTDQCAADIIEVPGQGKASA